MPTVSHLLTMWAAWLDLLDNLIISTGDWSQDSPNSHFAGLSNPTQLLHQALSTLVTLLDHWVVILWWILWISTVFVIWVQNKGGQSLPWAAGSAPAHTAQGAAGPCCCQSSPEFRAGPESLPLQKALPSCGQGICACWVPPGACQLINPRCLKPPGHNSAWDSISWCHQIGITWQLAESRLHLLLQGISTGIKQDKSQEGSWVAHWPPGWVWSTHPHSLSPATQAHLCAHPVSTSKSSLISIFPEQEVSVLLRNLTPVN